MATKTAYRCAVVWTCDHASTDAVAGIDAAHDFYPDWDGAADTCVAILRTEAGRDPHDKELHDLVGELSTLSA